MTAFRAGRYDEMIYNRCGRWGLRLPAISLGAWQTYGGYVSAEVSRRCLFRAFNLGITYFDFANNYGEPNGNAETVCGRIIREMPRDELVIASKAGYRMWPGPYGEWLSRKSLLASIDQSLRRLGLDYVDIFYAHRPDPETPTDEVMDALDQIVRSGKALYVGLSNHGSDEIRAKQGDAIARNLTRPIVSQSRYSLLDRHVEAGELQACAEFGMGFVAFTPLAQGMLTNKYLESTPEDSRLARSGDVSAKRLTDRGQIHRIRRLDELARRRGQTLAQLAIVWLLNQPGVTSVLIGASRPEQIEENVRALSNRVLSPAERVEIDQILME